ncbi:hypothetical protein M422DRAFT_255669 [Sphaerobolus stellatus SS14]|uniref:Ribonuclease H1 N-terminal domain-containing protein n=1 Tax=Sphaerobolus stellatus (strain SS14) TaxID=990650 RepID=A0A0C9VI78_SPHS4|nr:hypothetical protein M422DRAFT_255669 [Sphaerobolus stellatus SS14]
MTNADVSFSKSIRPECEAQVKGHPDATYKKFLEHTKAQEFVKYGWAALARDDTLSQDQCEEKPPPLLFASQATSNIIVFDPGEWDSVFCEAYQTEDASVGLGVWWGDSDPRNVSERCPGVESLDRGLMAAVVRALETVPPGNASLKITTTSLRCISLIQQSVNLMKAETVAEGVKQHDMPLATYLPRLILQIRRRGRRVCFKHVKDFSEIQSPCVKGARQLAFEGAYKETSRKAWGFPETNIGITGGIYSSIASLEFEL